MLLTIDIGNTNITYGVFEGEQLRATWRMATNINRMADEYAALLLNLLQHREIKTSDIKDIAIGSVVPPLTTAFTDISLRYFQTTPLIIVAGVKTGVRIHFDNPKEVGPDRIANAAAAHHLYTGPVIVIDFGTATTFDTVSREGDWMGGAIAPGIAVASEALYARTASLPRVELLHPERAIGTDTVSAMQSGIVFGYAGLIEGVVTRIQQELGEKATVVATGGYASLMSEETSVIDSVNPDITLIGLRLIYEMNRNHS
ncbi:MAG: type III pantothenate kinase [Dehalococcoidales bacterium]